LIKTSIDERGAGANDDRARVSMRPSLQKIHDASITILRDVGMRFHHGEILRLLRDHGIRVEAQTAFFTENQIMDRLALAPAKFTLHARNPEHSILIGGDRTHYAPGYGAVFVGQGNGQYRQALLEDYVKLAKLIHCSPCFKVNGGILAQPSDLVQEEVPPLLQYCAAVLSDKCMLATVGGPTATEMVIDLLRILAGGSEAFIARPQVIVPINTLSPLQVDYNSLEMLLQYARNGQPTMISPCVMAGTTGPVTLAGTIALANAEALAGIALTQMIRPGVPVLYGFQSTAADLRTGGITIGGPERSLCIAVGARLARAYGLPSRGGGADNDAIDFSEQSGYESMMSMLITRLEKINFVLHSAGMSASFAAVSYEQFIFGLEILGMVERYKRGIKVTPETLALEAIREAGIGGEFLTKAHTLKHLRKEHYVPGIGHRVRIGLPYDEQMLKREIQLKLQRMLAEHRPPDLPAHALEQMRSYLADRAVSTETVDRLLDRSGAVI